MEMVAQVLPRDGDEAAEIAEQRNVDPNVAVMIEEMRAHFVRARSPHGKNAKGATHVLSFFGTDDIVVDGSVFFLQLQRVIVRQPPNLSPDPFPILPNLAAGVTEGNDFA